MFKKLLFPLLLLSVTLNADCDYFQQGTTNCIPGDPVVPPGIWLPNCDAGDRLMQGQGETSCTETTPVDPPGLFLPGCQWYGDRLDQGTETCVNMHIPTLKKTGQTTIYAEFDDGHYQKGVVHSYARDDDKETVTDYVSRLMWQDDIQARSVYSEWEYAQTHCSTLSVGGYEDWRLPTRAELVGIVDYGRYGLSISTEFQNANSGYYWSATTHVSYAGSAWYVVFTDGYQGASTKSVSYGVRCVRAGE